ncbi:MAG TPA: DUF4438 domain-containing protein [Jatrophihabitans sp.]|nr:DUF4438 domain-containing protein [Jatrophihabitans sp.]
MSVPTAVAVNLIGTVEHPEFGGSPFAVAMDGSPYLPVGDAGIVLGVQLGDLVFGLEGDHVAPGATLTHPDQAARHALTSFACLGNEVRVRTGGAAGATGRVLGKRGEAGRVIVVFEPDVLATLAPGDAIQVRGFGQGSSCPPELAAAGAVVLNCDPAMLDRLQVRLGERASFPVRAVVPSKLVGNGLGRPAQQWDLDLAVTVGNAERWSMAQLRFGDLIAITDLDVRHNAGYRHGWTTVGVTVHGASRLPGHGPGVMPVFCGPSELVDVRPDAADHRGVTSDRLWS